VSLLNTKNIANEKGLVNYSSSYLYLYCCDYQFRVSFGTRYMNMEEGQTAANEGVMGVNGFDMESVQSKA
jgi:hypothetical protein